MCARVRPIELLELLSVYCTVGGLCCSTVAHSWIALNADMVRKFINWKHCKSIRCRCCCRCAMCDYSIPLLLFTPLLLTLFSHFLSLSLSRSQLSAFSFLVDYVLLYRSLLVSTQRLLCTIFYSLYGANPVSLPLTHTQTHTYTYSNRHKRTRTPQNWSIRYQYVLSSFAHGFILRKKGTDSLDQIDENKHTAKQWNKRSCRIEASGTVTF